MNKMQLQTLRTLVEQVSHERLHQCVQSDKVPAQDAEYQFYQELLGELKAQESLDNGWISVDDCPPKEPSILALYDNGTICEWHSHIKDDGYTDLENNGSYKITHWQHLQQSKRVNVKKQLNPLQSLIDELHQNKKLHSQLAKNAENENNRYNDNYVHFEKGVAFGFELALEKVVNFKSWQNAFINSPKFDVRRTYPNRPDFLVVVKNGNGSIQVDVYPYRFDKGEWVVPKLFEVLYWQELPILPKSLLK